MQLSDPHGAKQSSYKTGKDEQWDLSEPRVLLAVTLLEENGERDWQILTIGSLDDEIRSVSFIGKDMRVPIRKKSRDPEREFPVRSRTNTEQENCLKELVIFVEDNLRWTLFLHFLFIFLSHH